VRELLMHTDLSVNEISNRTGFMTLNRLENRFKKTFGKPMREYRNSKNSTPPAAVVD
jgi:transcriptional regulator GlxA family with amidase domain